MSATETLTDGACAYCGSGNMTTEGCNTADCPQARPGLPTDFGDADCENWPLYYPPVRRSWWRRTLDRLTW